MIEGAIAAALKDETAISDLLAQYADGRAIYSKGVLPQDAVYPAILISPVTGRGWGVRDSKGGDIQVDVSLFYDRNNTADKAMRALARAIWLFLDRAELPGLEDIDLENCGVYADPPIAHPDGSGFPGYLIRVRGVVLST